MEHEIGCPGKISTVVTFKVYSGGSSKLWCTEVKAAESEGTLVPLWMLYDNRIILLFFQSFRFFLFLLFCHICSGLGGCYQVKVQQLLPSQVFAVELPERPSVTATSNPIALSMSCMVRHNVTYQFIAIKASLRFEKRLHFVRNHRKYRYFTGIFRTEVKPYSDTIN